MKTVCAGLGNEADLPESGSTKLCGVRIGLHLEFLERVDGGPHGDIAELACVIAGSVQSKVVLIIAAPDGDSRAETSGGRSDGQIEPSRPHGRTRNQQEQLRKISA